MEFLAAASEIFSRHPIACIVGAVAVPVASFALWKIAKTVVKKIQANIADQRDTERWLERLRPKTPLPRCLEEYRKKYSP